MPRRPPGDDVTASQATYRAAAYEADSPRPPGPPTLQEKYSYFGHQKRWPFVWLFISQLCLLYSFAMVMKRTPDTALGLIFLTVMVPPVFVNLWLRIRRHRTGLVEHRERVARWRDEMVDVPSVDVLLPSCGEPLEVLDNTFHHVAQLEWTGRRTVWVLDDADLPAVRELAEQYGFEYLVRPNREPFSS